MIKLKKLLKESYVWERKFGEKLPTLADVQKKKLKEDLLTEKKELSSANIKDIAKMTNKNNHTWARYQLSGLMGNDKLKKFYNAMEDLNDVFNGFGPELSKLNKKMEKEFVKSLKMTFSNADEIYKVM